MKYNCRLRHGLLLYRHHEQIAEISYSTVGDIVDPAVPGLRTDWLMAWKTHCRPAKYPYCI